MINYSTHLIFMRLNWRYWMGKKNNYRKSTIGDKYRETNKYVLPKIEVGDMVAVKQNAKLMWFDERTRKFVVGRTGKVVAKGKYVYTVEIEDKKYHFQRLDLKTLV